MRYYFDNRHVATLAAQWHGIISESTSQGRFYLTPESESLLKPMVGDLVQYNRQSFIEGTDEYSYGNVQKAGFANKYYEGDRLYKSIPKGARWKEDWRYETIVDECFVDVHRIIQRNGLPFFTPEAEREEGSA